MHGLFRMPAMLFELAQTRQAARSRMRRGRTAIFTAAARILYLPSACRVQTATALLADWICCL